MVEIDFHRIIHILSNKFYHSIQGGCNTINERRERDLRFEWLMIVFLWVMAIDAILVMKTLQPNDRWYPVWTTAMCALITLLAAIRLA